MANLAALAKGTKATGTGAYVSRATDPLEGDDPEAKQYETDKFIRTPRGLVPTVAMPEITDAQMANILGGFVPGAAAAEIAGFYPAFPGEEVDVEEMLRSEARAPSLAENIEEGNYGTAALQGLGGLGDLAVAIPVVGGLVGAGLKAPAAIRKGILALTRTTPAVSRPVYTPKLNERGGKPLVREAEANVKAVQSDLLSADQMITRAQRLNKGFQQKVQRVADDLGMEKAPKYVRLKDGSDFDVEVKSAKSVSDKMERKGLAPSDFTDAIRTRVLVDSAEQADQAVARFSDMFPVLDRGWQVIPSTGYFDRKLNVIHRDPKSGQRIVGEIQISTKPMEDAAKPGHKWYEISRDLEKQFGVKDPDTALEIIPESHRGIYEQAVNEQIRLYGEARKQVDPAILRQVVEKFAEGGIATLQFGDYR